MNRYFLGIDAGATKTDYVLFDRAEQKVTALRGGPANHEVLPDGFRSLREVLSYSIGSLCTQAGIRMEEICAVAAGMGGVDTREQHRIISHIFHEIGLAQVVLANDAILGIKANCEAGAGVCAVNGSGFSVIAADLNGRWYQIGGLGELTGDQGGGAYLLGCVTSAVYNQLFRGGRETVMTLRLMQILGCADASGFVEALSAARTEDANTLRKNSSILINSAAEDGDAVARDILMASGITYARSILGAVNQLSDLKNSVIPVVLVGSNFTHFPDGYSIRAIKQALQQAQDCRFTVETVHASPVYVALLWACASISEPATESERTFLSNSLGH